MFETTEVPQVKILNAPTINNVGHAVAYPFRTIIHANLPPHVAPERAEKFENIRIPVDDFGTASCGTVNGQFHLLGYAINGQGVLVFANILATTISAREAWKASMDLGADMSMVRNGSHYAATLKVPREGKEKAKFAYDHDKFNLSELKVRQITSLLKSVADPTQAHLGRYIMETSLDNAQWALINIVSEITGLFIKPEWGPRLWHLAKAGRWISKCDAAPVPFWEVDQSSDVWTRVVQLAVAQGIFQF